MANTGRLCTKTGSIAVIARVHGRLRHDFVGARRVSASQHLWHLGRFVQKHRRETCPCYDTGAPLSSRVHRGTRTCCKAAAGTWLPKVALPWQALERPLQAATPAHANATEHQLRFLVSATYVSCSSALHGKRVRRSCATHLQRESCSFPGLKHPHVNEGNAASQCGQPTSCGCR